MHRVSRKAKRLVKSKEASTPLLAHKLTGLGESKQGARSIYGVRNKYVLRCIVPSQYCFTNDPRLGQLNKAEEGDTDEVLAAYGVAS